MDIYSGVIVINSATAEVNKNIKQNMSQEDTCQ